ncbi:ABC-F family ATP-binding cassette domain-containing protein [Gulosibacter molinativorax]|uniref:ABC transporter ATP-binding protein n=1 Tax=Gulosibacter molinativorax TaxID=256821 RepID=A0ABT7C6L8_9MICO|nr:ABC-F family ATP-binding cassette domain-containing protein [Gulosibacter molinativorax]MDJ1370835.1 ABC transporter ATP-binding protein [Gulosibacter molinativorax]QUY62172.1 Macrolide ABC transporter ATP-binding protein [Gulosibacter molinativorax]
MAHLLGAERISLEYPTKVVFEDITIGIGEGDRIGIVGRNGDGKSTLMKIVAGRIEPDSGQVTVRGGTTVGMLDQADTVDETLTVREAIVGDIPEHEWAGDAKIRDIIRGLASDLDWDALVGTLSGGQRRRVALAKLLIGDWDILLLDEPTNHLDIEGVSWLARHLNSRWPKGSGALVVVTHDRWFLDAVCNTTWEVHDRILEPFDGGYAAYILQRVERDRQAAAVEQKRQNLMRKELAWLRRGAPARTAKPKFRIEAANELISDVPPVRNPIELTQLATARLGKDVVDLVDVAVSFDSTPLFSDVTWRIAPGERTGILGVNGAGKSTLLQLISGDLEPTSGRVKHGKTVKIAKLTQQLGELAEVENDKVHEIIARQKKSYVAAGQELTPSMLLERLGFTSAQLQTPVKDLSGGQRRRLQLLLILLEEPNVLILDEPTNDLDTDMLAAVEDLLDTWPGTLIVVSHDRYLLERVTDQQYAVIGGTLRHLPGGVDEYLKLRDAEERAGAAGRATSAGRARVDGRVGAEGAVSRSTASDDRVGAGSTVSRSADPTLTGAAAHAARKEIGAIERKLEKLGKETAAFHAKMAEHDQSDFEGLGKLTQELQALEAESESLEERWLELSEQLD